jgi:hypothetical protein
MSDDHIKLVVAREHGLDSRHVPWLVGSTVAELEQSAVTLRQLLGEREGQEPEPPAAPATDPFTLAAQAKSTRQRSLRAALTGRREPQRDEAGKFRKASFDGGAARQPWHQPDPQQAHNQTIAEMMMFSRTFRR